jgi:hypothetical protein
MRRVSASIALSGLLVSSVSAATFSHFTTKEHREVIVLTGEITAGDADRFVAIVKESNAASREVSGLRLNSPGGDLAEGAKLADAVRFAKVATVVVTKTTCASACFIVFAAGSEKFVGYGAQVGVHGASTSAGQETVDSRAATIAMAKIIKELGVPAAIIGQMVVTPPDQIVWLSTPDLQGMGVTMVGKPTQTAAPTPPNGAPPQQTRNTSADTNPSGQTAPLVATLPTDKNAQWTDIVNRAMSQSSSQNGGTPNMARVCQPELKICNLAIMFKGTNGKSMMVRVAEDVNEKIVSRDICTFNDFGDVRSCIDWDTGVQLKEMKNAAGNWYAINE